MKCFLVFFLAFLLLNTPLGFSESNPDTEADALIQEANRLMAERQWDTSAEKYEEALKLNPDLTEALFGLGLIAETENDFNAAHDYFRSVIQRNPRHVDSLFHLGAIAYSREQPSEARDYFRLAAESSPNMIPAHYNLGLCYTELYELEKARESFKQAIILDAKNPWPFYQIGRTYEMQGFAREARMGYEEALKLNPNFPEAREGFERLSGINPARGEDSIGEMRQKANRQVSLIGGSFGSGGFKPVTPLDSFRDLAYPAQSTNNKAMLMQLGAQLVQGFVNSRRQQS